jgi:hypothetical protein
VYGKGGIVGRRLISVLFGLVLVVSACSSSDSGEVAADAGESTTSSAAAASTGTDTTVPTVSTTKAAAEPASGGSPTATVTLDNGESYVFSVLCNIEPQEAAGSEILFTAVSNEEPYGFDATQFGQLGAETGGVLDGSGSITIWDSSTYDDIWASDSILAQLGGTEFSLELNGTTITGSGMFVEGGDIEKLNSAVHGDLVAECG